MRDKVTKKRVKVDYTWLVHIAGLEPEFFCYVKTKKRISLNRLALSFLRINRVNIEELYARAIDMNCRSYEEYVQEQIRIAKTPWLDD